MNNLVNLNEFRLNTEAYYLSEENIQEISKIYSHIVDNEHDLDINDYTYHPNAIDEELPTLITTEVDCKIKVAKSDTICCLLEPYEKK